MATVSPMTWSWNWKLAATGAAVVAGWLGVGSPIHLAGPAPRAQVAEVPQTDARITAASLLQEETRRLDVRVEAGDAAPPSRNLFRFGSRPVVRRAAAPAPVVMPAPVAPLPAPFPLRLTGIAVDVVNGVEQRTAILSGPSGVELAARGEAASPGYRVVEVGESFADVERTSDGRQERLTLGR